MKVLLCILLFSTLLYASDSDLIFDSDSDEDREFIVEMKTLSHHLLLTKISDQHARELDALEKIEKKYENLKVEQEQIKKNEMNKFRIEMCEDILGQLAEAKKSLLEKNEEMIKEITDLLINAKMKNKEES